MAGTLPSYRDFLAVQARGVWDADAIELTGDARAWAALSDAARRPLQALLGTFVLGEDGVARDIAAFAPAAGDADRAACFAAQQRDEERHAKAFARIEAEVAREPLRQHAPPGLRELLEQRLPAMASGVADGDSLAAGVALYHGIVEGVVFLAGQDALLQRLPAALAGCTEIVRRTQKDERWHVAFGMRLLRDLEGFSELDLLAEAERALAAWGDLVDAPTRTRTLAALQRRIAYSTSKSAARAASSIDSSSRVGSDAESEIS